MYKKLIQCTFVVLVLLLLTLPTLGAIGEDQIKQIAEPYRYSDEGVLVYGPYTYKNEPYYLVDFYPENDENLTTGVLIIDAETEKIVSNKEITDKIIIAHRIAYFVSSQSISNLEITSKYYGNYIEFIKEDIKITEESAKLMNQQSNFSSIIEANRKVENSSSALKENIDQQIIISKKIYAGERSYENAIELKTLNEKYISLLEECLDLRVEYRAQSVRYYDLGNQMGYNSNRYEWESGREQYLAGIDANTKIIEDELKMVKDDKAVDDGYINFTSNSIDSRLTGAAAKTPGFSLLVSVFALLIVGIFIKKQKK